MFLIAKVNYFKNYYKEFLKMDTPAKVKLINEIHGLNLDDLLSASESKSVAINSSINIDEAVKKFTAEINNTLTTEKCVDLLCGKVASYKAGKTSMRKAVNAINQMIYESKSNCTMNNKKLFLFVVHSGKNCLTPLLFDSAQKASSKAKNLSHSDFKV